MLSPGHLPGNPDHAPAFAGALAFLAAACSSFFRFSSSATAFGLVTRRKASATFVPLSMGSRGSFRILHNHRLLGSAAVLQTCGGTRHPAAQAAGGAHSCRPGCAQFARYTCSNHFYRQYKLLCAREASGRTPLPVVEAKSDDLGDVVEGDLLAALEGHQRACSTVDDHVAPDAVNVQQAADLADLQLDLSRAFDLRVPLQVRSGPFRS